MLLQHWYYITTAKFVGQLHGISNAYDYWKSQSSDESKDERYYWKHLFERFGFFYYTSSANREENGQDATVTKYMRYKTTNFNTKLSVTTYKKFGKSHDLNVSNVSIQEWAFNYQTWM